MNITNLKKQLNNKRSSIIIALFLAIASLLVAGHYSQKKLVDAYQEQNSAIIKDRQGEVIAIELNDKDCWAQYLDEIPKRFKILLIKKEDEYFYYHLGFNPWSIIRSGAGYLGFGQKGGSSTITQQLVKILLKKEPERSLKNKAIELFYALNLELYQSKETILKMYANSIYFGNQAQGLKEASNLYFGISPDMLTDNQIMQLLATISSPTQNNPSKDINQEIALVLANKLGLNSESLTVLSPSDIEENMKNYSHFAESYFEAKDLIDNPNNGYQLTIDNELTEKIRMTVDRNIEDLRFRGARNAAVVIIKLPENELITLIGSPDPSYFEEGYQINMLNEPRPIGSTIKPFIYLKSFEKGLRPYTLVNDREYKYITAVGFPLYPKNFDYKYRGEVSLHYALSNSLNVPAVKVLEYVGLKDFYNFLEKDLEFKPIQDLNNYQLGIALGALEMKIIDLAHYFTIFPNNGTLKPLTIYQNNKNTSEVKKIAEEKYIQLVNRILNDRITGIEQFGLKSDLNLFQSNYALKTGTSKDFRDSWVIGYTPDFLVGVWVGNHDNSPTEGITGQVGSGRIWSETMEILLNSSYNKKTAFKFNMLEEFYKKDFVEYGLPEDNYEKHLNTLKEQDLNLILNPHNEDVFLLEENTKIMLEAKESVKWFIDENFLSEGQSGIFIPEKPGLYKIKAEGKENSEEMVVLINEL